LKKTFVLTLCAAALALAADAAFAEKPVLGVAEFRNNSGAYWWGGGVGWELSGMLTNELAATNSFTLVERSKLEPVLQEQDLADYGRVKKGTGAKIGQLTGAQYLVLGTVSSFERDVDSTRGGVGFKGIRVGGKKEDAYIAVDLRVVDSTSGEIKFVRSVEARASSKGVNLGLYKGGFGGNLQKESKTPAGKAIRAVIVEISDYLECAMVKQDGCMAEFDAKERKRRDSLKDGIKLD
jgi:curli biogenesis system outer membrane secretion channel CsgG